MQITVSMLKAYYLYSITKVPIGTEESHAYQKGEFTSYPVLSIDYTSLIPFKIL